ncbi:MAG: DUF364 domain-containing protein [Candidatus Abyssubacteria bacterium]
MKVIDDIIATITEDSPVKEVRTCLFWTAVISRKCGLASTLREDAPHHAKYPVRDAGSLTMKTARQLADYAHSTSLPEASIGMAAINSLLHIDAKRCVNKNAFDILRERGAGKKIAIIGHFPFIPALREIAGTLWVLEKRPGEDDLPEHEAETILPQADIVGMTATTLINHSFDTLMPLCKNSFVVLLGPSTPLSPILFDYGVDVLSGIEVLDPDMVIKKISEGANFRQMEGVKLLTMIR